MGPTDRGKIQNMMCAMGPDSHVHLLRCPFLCRPHHVSLSETGNVRPSHVGSGLHRRTDGRGFAWLPALGRWDTAWGRYRQPRWPRRAGSVPSRLELCRVLSVLCTRTTASGQIGPEPCQSRTRPRLSGGRNSGSRQALNRPRCRLVRGPLDPSRAAIRLGAVWAERTR